MPLRIGLAQTTPRARDLAGNLRSHALAVDAAADQGVKLVLQPELSLTGYELDYLAATPAAWLRPDDGRLDGLRATCREHGVAIVVGGAYAMDGARPWLAALVIDARGELIVSGKQHLHGAEHEIFQAGAPAAPFEVAGWRVSIAVCFDASKPGHASAAAAAGADLYAVSAIYSPGQERRMDLHLGARAMDNRMFAAVANCAGTTGGFATCGLSGVWRPSGDAVCRAPADREAFLVAELDPAELAAFRS